MPLDCALCTLVGFGFLEGRFCAFGQLFGVLADRGHVDGGGRPSGVVVLVMGVPWLSLLVVGCYQCEGCWVSMIS